MLKHCSSFLFILIVLISSSTLAQNSQPLNFYELSQQWNNELNQVEKELSDAKLSDDRLSALRTQLLDLQKKLQTTKTDLSEQQKAYQTQLTELGPPPAEGILKESKAIARKRQVLNASLSETTGQVKETELIQINADNLIERLSAIRLNRFTKEIFSRSLSPLSGQAWLKAGADALEKYELQISKYQQFLADETFISRLKSSLAYLFISLIPVLILMSVIGNWLRKRYGRVAALPDPSYHEKLRAGLVLAIVRTLYPMTIAIGLFILVQSASLTSYFPAPMVKTVLSVLVMIFLVTGISRSMLAPDDQHWRLTPISTDNAAYVHKIIIGLSILFGADLIIDNYFSLEKTSLEFNVIRKFLAGVLISGFLFALVIRKNIWQPDTQHNFRNEPPLKLWQRLRVIMALLVLAIPVTALAGYVAMSRLLAAQIVLTAGLYILLSTLKTLGMELIEELLDPDSQTGSNIQTSLDLDLDGKEILEFWVKVVFSFIMFFIGIIGALIIWGVDSQDMMEWGYKAFLGFKIGDVTISISNIFLAIFLFAGTLLLTRVTQRTLENRILPRTRIDKGIQHSIRAALGYVGFIMAFMAAISTLGLDLSNLAMIAGALSVGIGFGLQNVVNNFVSGLILLIERPVKVGDWVVVGDQKGHIKKINVRATEIETSDRATLFIPNSELISRPLMNWTHANQTGRLVLPVQIAYGTDTQKVKAILLKTASKHPEIQKYPEPNVLFRGYGESALNLELRAFLFDVEKVNFVMSDLFFEIDDLFRQEGIEIPYPQRDIQLKDSDKFLQALAAAISDNKHH
ncbi:DUF3772 domain-containing protein [Methylicorpusculum oleiharenae]|uniref:DUF3772 domain-containing protein n=1 Tax=Methylicorpusculum oleiharenae TaxID=1338687 RepID=UPI001358ACA5|nr:DUF3772 domain-containing protein [Methylicorpusculum oleiharenae]MCD2450344.1 DUF3772 domain-containing protein [Methylicorpusculum oleiharenae]